MKSPTISLLSAAVMLSMAGAVVPDPRAYTLQDAFRDAAWRRRTAAMLERLQATFAMEKATRARRARRARRAKALEALEK